MRPILRKLRTLLSIDPKWAYRFLRKRAVHQLTFKWSRLIGRKYWDADVVGVPLRFTFFAPYHHRIAYFYHTGLFERSALSVWKDQAKEANVIYDIGGFSGIYGLLAAKVNPNARILIFEPDVINAEHIRKNIKANGLSNCEVDEAAVSDVPGTARFSQGGSSGERLSEWGREVRVETLDDLPPANLIKIDVEGAEAKVIAGGKHALQKKPKIMLEIHPWGLSEADQEQMWSTLRGLGYQWKQVADDTEGSPHYLVS